MPLDREIIEELSRPYMTPSERAADRKARAQPGLFNTQSDRPDEAPELKVAVNVWVVQQQDDPAKFALIRCPSRSGAKIYADNVLGLKGPFYSWIADESVVEREGAVVHDPRFETVPEFAERMEREKKEKSR